MSFYNSANTVRSGYLQILDVSTAVLAVEVNQGFNIQTNSSNRLLIAAAGNITLGVPTAGTTLTIGSVAAGNGLIVNQSGGGSALSVNALGNTIISAPSSGVALTIAGASATSVINVTTTGLSVALNVNGAAATQVTGLQVTQGGQTGWQIYNPASSSDFRVATNSTDRLKITAAGEISINSAATFYLASTTTLANNAAAAAGTLTNAPAAGNPTKWIKFDDNGVTRSIPCW